MITINRAAQALARFFEATGKARVNSALLSMGRAKAEELGYSYEALCAGPSAWPWRKTSPDSAVTSELGAKLHKLDRISQIPHKTPQGNDHEIEQDAA